jgi:general secretion pathway protein L
MISLSIDIGSYSVKFLQANVDKKSFRLIKYQEIPYDQVVQDLEMDRDDPQLVNKLIRSYLDQQSFQGRYYFQMPTQLVTTRYLDLPVGNKKKAELMIPFQLDESLPFQTGEAHLVSQISKEGNGSHALVSLTKTQEFETYYQDLVANNVCPAVLTSEASLLRSFGLNSIIDDNYCVLDIGHKYAKAYFFRKKKLIQNNYNQVAGELLTSVIAKTYKISQLEASLYKHENSFLLVEDQFTKVNEDQKEFALLMKNSLSPLVIDLKRWLIGYNMKTGENVKHIYLMGGSSNIRNIENFLLENLGLSVSKLNVLSLLPMGKDSSLDTKKSGHALCEIMSITSSSKETPANFLFGAYSSDYTDHIPMASSAFVASRVYIVCLFLFLGLFVERLILSSRLKELDKKNVTLLKSEALQVPKKTRDMYVKKPDMVLLALKKRLESILGEIKAIEEAEKIHATNPLLQLSQIIGDNEKVDVISFSSSSTEASATFVSEEKNEIEDVKLKLMESSLDGLEVNHPKEAKELKIQFKGI